jgi:NAD(P) transhydrogenase subunit alpha
VVTATDVRPAAKEQVASLGAKFLAVEDEEFKAAETAGGYAKEMSKEYQVRQAALTAEHIAKQDIVITTALIRAAGPEAGLGGDGRFDEAGLGDRRPGGRARRQCRRRRAGRDRRHGQRRQDRRAPQRAGPRRSLGLSALCQEPLRLPRALVDKAATQLAINHGDVLVKATMLTKPAVVRPIRASCGTCAGAGRSD